MPKWFLPLAIVCALMFAIAPVLIANAPYESTMGLVQKIFYVHLPSAWTFLLAAIVCVRRGRSGWAFALTGAGAVLTLVTVFTSLFPRLMVSSTDFANSLTVDDASSAHYTLEVMTVVALVVTPVVVLYQAWTYRVFRGRLGTDAVEEAVDSAAPKGRGELAT